MSYLFSFQGTAFSPNGTTDVQPVDVDARNRETESAELAHLATQPEKLFLYVKMPAETLPFCSYWSGRGDAVAITTWLGTSVSEPNSVSIGRRTAIGGFAGRYAYKRAVRCRIAGAYYHGWYYESAGSYCRLSRSKQQH